MKCRSKVAVPGRAEAVARVEAVGDPHAAAALWKVFAADASHHGLIVGVLGRFATREASQMLAALAVYSRDEKARAAAVAAVRARSGRVRRAARHTDADADARRGSPGDCSRQGPGAGAPRRRRYGELPVPLLQGGGTDSGFPGGMLPAGPQPGEMQFARQFNEDQAAMARLGLDQQVAMAKQMIEKYNDSIRALNQRVARGSTRRPAHALDRIPRTGGDGWRWPWGRCISRRPTAPSRPSPRSWHRSTTRRSCRPPWPPDGAESPTPGPGVLASEQSSA